MAPSTPPRSSSSTPLNVATDNNEDMGLGPALLHAVEFLLRPLQSTYPLSTLAALKETLTSSLTTRLSASTWDVSAPQLGSASRSLIAYPGVLPRPLREAAKTHGIETNEWIKGVGEGKKQEWELWIDPGCVKFREGGWEWEDTGFEPNVRVGKRDRIVNIWQAPSTLPQSLSKPTAISTTTTNITPARVSRAIPIRAPTLFHIPPTPIPADDGSVAASEAPGSPSPSLLPAFIQSVLPRASSPAESQSSSSSSDDQHSHSSIHGRRHASNSSIASTNSIQSQTHLLTPGPRPGSADPFLMATHTGGSGKDAATPTTSTSGISGKTITPGTATPAQTPGGSIAVQRYDGVNVGVLGGGVKLGGGGGSRPPSSRVPLGERSRSPSVSYPYNTPLSYGAPASPRKTHFGGPNMPSQRTRRRIMPTYLGSVNAPGIAGPQGAFSQGHGYMPQPPHGYPMPMPRMSGY